MVEFVIAFIASMLITSSVNTVEVDTQMINQAVSEPVVIEEETEKEMSLAGIESEIGRLSLQLESTIGILDFIEKDNPDNPDLDKLRQTKIDVEEMLAELEQMRN